MTDPDSDNEQIVPPLSRTRARSEHDLTFAMESGEELTAFPADQNASPFELIQDRLYGRWRTAAIVGVILAAIFGCLGFLLAPIKYQAQSVISVQSGLNETIAETPETADLRQFSAFVQENAQKLRGRAVLIEAFKTPSLAEVLRADPEFRSDIITGLNVVNPRGSSMVFVSLENEDPIRASIAVNAIVQSFMKVYAPTTAANYEATVQSIRNLLFQAETRLTGLQNDRRAQAAQSNLGSGDIDEQVEFALDQILATQAELRRVEERMLALREW